MPILSGHLLPAVTMIPDTFLDEYMPAANGEFVKIYLYLLKQSRSSASDLSLNTMADFFGCTENDILRALRYWEKTELLSLTYLPGESAPSGITLLPVLTAGEKLQREKEAELYREREREEALRIAYEKRAAQLSARRNAQDTKKEEAENPASGSETAKAEPIGISGTRAAELSENEDVKQLIFVSESYFGRPLSPTEVNRILYFYDELKFDLSLVEYLIEYCVSKNHANIHYIEKVGLAWHRKGITTVEQARQESTVWEKDYFLILNAMGIRNRNPVPSEVDYMNKWLKDYQFSADLIQAACERTLAQIHQPSFAYTDKILTNWHKNNVSSGADIKALDDQHQQYQQKKKEDTGKSVSPSPEKNRFNNFPQRNYDYNSLEKKLLEL